MRAGKLPCLRGGCIGPRMETCVNWGGTIALVPSFHQGNVYIKRKLQVWRQQKYIPLVGAETLLTCAGRQATLSHGGRYRAENGNLHKLGWTYHHGTVFATKKYVYPKEVWVWREQKCISLVGGETPITCVGRQTTPSHVGRYRAENGHLHTLG